MPIDVTYTPPPLSLWELFGAMGFCAVFMLLVCLVGPPISYLVEEFVRPLVERVWHSFFKGPVVWWFRFWESSHARERRDRAFREGSSGDR